MQIQKPKIRIKRGGFYNETLQTVESNSLATVCQEASCPNIQECWSKKHASFMIMGSICTRKCAFCNVATGKPLKLDPAEPTNVAAAVLQMGLEHVVITSVDRDDLEDGGANHFAEVIRAIRIRSQSTTIEVLTPDFLNKNNAEDIVIRARPDVFNHNIETVPSLYLTIRPKAKYFNSLRLLNRVKDKDPDIFTKSGLMLGLGEERAEVLQVMDDLRCAGVDFLTIGQYLQPTPKHAKVIKYAPPEEFEEYQKIAYRKGFLMVSSSALTRSSYHAGDDFRKLQQNKQNINSASRN